MKVSKLAACFLLPALSGALLADNARFDLAGPKIDVRVTRGAMTLPIAEVPNLQPGDKIWVKADLPASQSNHLLLVVAFLRGTTNEPPDNWFTEIDTWEKKSVEGTTITVPEGAEQALLFVAPETGGDFKTLRSAVKGKPGLFIRSDADLNEASFEQQRIEHYLEAMKTVPQDDPKAIQDRSAKLAATLALKPNADCFKQPVDAQVNCLTQASAPVLLDDGHGQGVAEALSTGASSDFINAASYTQPVGGGAYSAYVGALVDLVHLTSALRTAQYQYIPAISFPQGSTLNLKLNAPPSFHNPKSVIVIGLPAIQKGKLPPLRPHDPNQVACLLQPKMTLPLEGAPLVFSTSFAHDLVLHLNRTGAGTELPLASDAFEGGLVLAKETGREPLPAGAKADVNAGSDAGKGQPSGKADGALPADAKPADAKTEVKLGTPTDLTITGTVRGYWGFDSFEGPNLTVQQVAGKGWKIVGDTQLLAGQANHLTLQGDGTGCVEKIALSPQEKSADKDKDIDVAFKPVGGDGKDSAGTKNVLALDVSLQKVQPGGYALAIAQYGETEKSLVPLMAYNSNIHLTGLQIHAGDQTAILVGDNLGNVVSAQVGDQTFTPAGDGHADKTLPLQAKAGVTPADGADATVKLKDGRTMTVKIVAEAARPGLHLLSITSVPAKSEGMVPVMLGAKDDIALNGKLTFVVETKEVFPRTQTVEVATANGSVHTVLSLADNTLVLQDEHTAIATLDPLKAFGQSAFGKLQMRPVAADGTPGNWTPLGTLVRTPGIAAVHCTTGQVTTCTVEGSNLFLVQSFGATKDFSKPAEVPTGFAESSIAVPVPADGRTLYLKLRDNAESVGSLTLPTPVPQPAADAAPAPAAAAPAPTAPSFPASAQGVPPPAARAPDAPLPAKGQPVPPAGVGGSGTAAPSAPSVPSPASAAPPSAPATVPATAGASPH